MSQEEQPGTLHQLAVRLKAVSSIDLLCDHLERLRRISSADLVLSAGAQEHYRQTIAEADAAYSQVATLLEEFSQELEDHRHRLQQAQEHQKI